MPDRPQILVVDCPEAVGGAVRDLGFPLVDASFGSRIHMVKSADPVRLSTGNLPSGYGESDIVIVDLNPPFNPKIAGNRAVSSVSQTFASAETGIVDWRPIQMQSSRECIDRILSHGGVLVVFLDARQWLKFVTGHYYKTSYGGIAFSSDRNPPTQMDTWGFSSLLHNCTSQSDSGSAITANVGHFIGRALQTYLETGAYACTLNIRNDVTWEVLATSKFGAPVAAISRRERTADGLILLLPQVEDKGGLVSKLLREVLPDLQPHIFESGLGAKWLHSAPYELPEINLLKAQITAVEEEAERRIERLRDAINAERERSGYLHTLITGTGDELVTAVQRALETLGFERIVDLDAVLAEEGGGRQKREDLQVHDRSPTLIVEVKGIAGYPSDDDALAVHKYVTLRMKEWNRTDVQGLAIINHQRHLPALLRENTLPFRQEILDNASELGFGLLTTWDLHRLVRSAVANSWKGVVVQDVLYRAGRIQPIPSHYLALGTVEAFIPKLKVVGIRLCADLSLGARIAFETETQFIEEKVSTLQLENADVQVAKAGSLAGTVTTFTKQQIPIGTRVFLLNPLNP